MSTFTQRLNDNHRRANMEPLQVIAEHTVNMAILRKPANILDLGCLGFEFCNYFDRRGDFVIPVDIQELHSKRPYLRIAVTGRNGLVGITPSLDAQAVRINHEGTGELITAMTLEKLCEEAKVPYFDLIKMDIEAAEYEVIMSLTKAPAKQLSIEMHLHCGQTEQQVEEMVSKLVELGYTIVQHEKTARHGLAPNYWDTLAIHNYVN